MVDEGVGAGVIELEGVGEADGGGVGVVEGAGEIIGDGEGDGVAAAKSGEIGPITSSGRVKIRPLSMNFPRSTSHCYINRARTAR